jgi:quercetin dioxygenase-like cupin family protein
MLQSQRFNLVRTLSLLLIASVSFAVPGWSVIAQEHDQPSHELSLPDDLEWQDGPPSLEPGAEFVILEGNPSEEGLFTMRLRLPDGFQIAPHSHPAIEHVTVVQGEFNIGSGEEFDSSNGMTMPVGAFIYLMPGHVHYAWASEDDTIIQLHGEGPWQINYVNPDDDPREE